MILENIGLQRPFLLMKHLLFSLPKDLKFVLNALMFRKHLSVPYFKLPNIRFTV